MADVILKNAEGIPQTYTGVEEVLLDTPDGGKAAFVLDGGGITEIPEYVIQTGDTVSELYFNRNYDVEALIGSINAALNGSPILLLGEAIGAKNYFTLTPSWTEGAEGAREDVTLTAYLKQGTEEATLIVYKQSMGGWLVTYLDLNGFNLGVATNALSYDGALPLFAKAEVPEFNTFGGGVNGLGLEHGDTVSEVHFNSWNLPGGMDGVIDANAGVFLALISIDTGANLILRNTISPDTRFGESVLSISVGLGLKFFKNVEMNTAFIADEETETVIWSFWPFDWSATVPWMKSETGGWLVQSITFQEPRTMDFKQVYPVYLVNLQTLQLGVPTPKMAILPASIGKAAFNATIIQL